MMMIFWDLKGDPHDIHSSSGSTLVRRDVTEMPYMLIFKGYLGDKIKFEEWHYFSTLDDLYNYAAVRLKYVGSETQYDRYDIQVKLTKTDNTPPAA